MSTLSANARMLDTAKGVLVALHRCSVPAAFDEILRVAHRHSVPALALAGALVALADGTADTATDPAALAAHLEWGHLFTPALTSAV
ncbi:ANTAR domain-containing protein [Nocardia sp. BMG111209]|uniref:ANTAR domain-containing protein n=1 Tax=Nocardia sp. BMG111209 TaxID=1160137 RepID=UPI00039BAD8F|nr:ANTAR domain-containing protein [Nocardia sp. BMG111209]